MRFKPLARTAALTAALTLALTAALPLAPGAPTGEALAKERAAKDAKDAKDAGGDEKKSRGGGRRALAKTLDKKMRSGYGLIGARLLLNFAGLGQAREGAKDPFLSDPSSSASVGFGLSLERGVNKLVSFRAEALFQNKNFSHKSPLQYDLKKSSTKLPSDTYLDYIEVPIGVVVRFMYGQLIRPYASAGLYGAFLVNADGTHEGEGENGEARKPFTSFDGGWYLSGGSFFVLGEDSGFLGAELRYSQGLDNVADTTVEASDKTTPLAKQTYTMRNFALSVSYHF